MRFELPVATTSSTPAEVPPSSGCGTPRPLPPWRSAWSMQCRMPASHITRRCMSGGYTHHAVTPTGQALDPVLEAAHQYLLGTCAGPLSPDITLTLVENMVVRNRLQGNASSAHGNHSGPTWGVQHIPLVIAGPGVKAGAVLDFPARLMDIAPTALTLMGIQPTRMDGIQLSDALMNPTSAAQRATDDLAPRITAYQRAISAQSAADLQDQKAAAAAP